MFFLLFSDVPPDNSTIDQEQEIALHGAISPTLDSLTPFPSKLLQSPSSISYDSTVFDTVDFVASPSVVYHTPRQKKICSVNTTPTTKINDKPDKDQELDSIIEEKSHEKQNIDTSSTTSVEDFIESSTAPEQSASIQEDYLQTDLILVSAPSITNVNPHSPSLLDLDNNDVLIMNLDEMVSTDERNEETGMDKNEKVLTRKRSCNDTEWISKKNKFQKNSGQDYVGSKSKKKFAAKTMGDVCSCKRKCGDIFNEERRKCIFNTFWSSSSHEKQWDFINRHVKAESIKKMSLERKNNRTQTFTYFFKLVENTSTMTIVCKKFFLNTLSISEKFVYTAIEKGKFDKIEDNRGKHDNRPHKMSKNTEESVIAHIKMFPVKESHYVRKTTKKLYLEETLNISKMYRLYKDWFQEQNYLEVQMASKRQYETVFNTKFNYSFHKPKKDLCTSCSIYNNADSEKKNDLEETHNVHLKNKETVRNLKNQDKEQSDPTATTVAIYDLEKVLTIPQSEVSIFYYKRKYPIYNLTVYDTVNKKGHCYLWHYQIAKRGANDVGSCILNFIENECKRGIKNFIFYSDGCAGQNKNRIIFSMYLYAAKKFDINITHRYFETGHSQSEADSMHSCIERAKRNQIIYTPDQMYAIIMNAKVNGQKFELIEMKQSQFFDLKELMPKKYWLKTETGAKISWSKIHEISILREQPDILQFKYNYDEELQRLNTASMSRSSRGRGKSSAPTTLDDTLKTAYSSKIKLPKPLYDDLSSLCRTEAIPTHYQPFYRDMQCDGGSNSVESDGGISDSE